MIGLLTNPDLFPIDIGDVRTVMVKGRATEVGTAKASGSDRAQAAMEAALCWTTLSRRTRRTSSILIVISCNRDLTVMDFDAVSSKVKEFATEDATVVIGVADDPTLGNEIRVTVFATCLGQCTYH
ncbi:MAG: hypothetical protein GY801_35410 [bacterium]|nr:hypothetical protein [bacterium]